MEPDPVALAERAERAGADGITVHLREDRRHIQERDVWRLREAVSTRLNLEIACTPAMIDFALKLRPQAVCVVPENRREVTTEGGLDVAAERDRVRACVKAMGAAGIEASLFIDPDEAQIELSAKLGAPAVELHTGAYANAFGTPRRAAGVPAAQARRGPRPRPRAQGERGARDQLCEHRRGEDRRRTCTS